MKIKVVVESQVEVDAWLKSQQPVFKKVEAVPAIMNATDSTVATEPVNKLALK
jgi:hypothetical protein